MDRLPNPATNWGRNLDWRRMKPGAVVGENAPLFPASWLLWQFSLGAQIYVFARKSNSGGDPL